jgi:hypothetical protein
LFLDGFENFGFEVCATFKTIKVEACSRQNEESFRLLNIPLHDEFIQSDGLALGLCRPSTKDASADKYGKNESKSKTGLILCHQT